MKKTKNLEYLSLIKYLLIFFGFLIFNNLEREVTIYSSALYVTVLTLNFEIISTTLLYLTSFVITGNFGLLPIASIVSALFIVLTILYRIKKAKAKYELTAYMLLAMICFVFLGDVFNPITVERRIFISLATCLLTLIMTITGYAISEKGLKYKFSYDEFATVIALTSLTGLGVCNLISPYLWRGISVFLILLSAFVYRTGVGTLISAVLGIGLSIFYSDISYVSVTLVWGIIAISFMKLSRYLSALSIIVADYIIQVVFNYYTIYGLPELLSVLSGAVVFACLPTKPLKNIKEKLYTFREKQLVRQSINRNRLMLSNRLYELSGVFNEMANAFYSLKKETLKEKDAKKVIIEEILCSVCEKCEFYSACHVKLDDKKYELEKLVEIGMAKGRTSLIDFPRELSKCARPNNILYSVNKLIADYRSYVLDRMNVKNGRDLLASEAVGVSEILSGLALETGTLLKYQGRLERELGNNLFKKGIKVSELLIYGEGENTTVGIIIAMKEFSLNILQSVISETIGMDMTLFEKSDVTEDKSYLFFKKSADYDAVFGIVSLTKDGSDSCGDTHSVLRIKDDKFLVAVSDGMGSGKDAQRISSCSLSLIESFYKAGLSGNLILNTVNKLLSINTEDTFTALDISVIDLRNCTADFIKYGAPYGFIIGEAGIKIVESNTLPLGILEELKPSVCSSSLSDGDMLLLLSDGVSDAFGSSSEVIDFLKTIPAKNPQTLAEEIVGNALQRTDGKKKDDMTALCVRVFKCSA